MFCASPDARYVQQRLRAFDVLGRLAQHEAINWRVHRVLRVHRVDRREREEVEVGLIRLVRELLADERAEQEHAGLLADERLRGVLPLAAERAVLMVRQQRRATYRRPS